jgi:hypothetical protein
MKYLEPSTLPKVPQVKLDLIAARELIKDKENWIQGMAYRMTHDERLRRCAMKAVVDVVKAEYLYPVHHRIIKAREALTRVIPGDIQDWCVETFNDTHEHSDVLKLFDDAIQGVER